MADPTTDDVQTLARAVESLQETVDRRIAEDPAREAAVSKLYAELKDYKDDFLAEAEKPLLRDLLLLYDSMNWFHRDIVSKQMSPEATADAFQYLIDELLEVLYRRDVVPMEAKETFDPTHHKAVQLQKAGSADEDNAVAQVLKRGFVRRDKPLRPEEVVVYKWRGGSEGGA